MRTGRSSEPLPVVTPGAWSLRSRHLTRRRSGAADRGRSLNISSIQMILDEIRALDRIPERASMGKPKGQAPHGSTIQPTPRMLWPSPACCTASRHTHSPRRHPRSHNDTDMKAVVRNSNKIDSPLAPSRGHHKEKRERSDGPNPYTLALELLKHLDRQRSGIGHRGRSQKI